MNKFGKDPEDKGRTMQEVSKDTQTAGFDENPEPQMPTPPKEKSPADMKNNPDAYLDEKDIVGD